MNYTATDYHKRYSFASALNEQGQRRGEARPLAQLLRAELIARAYGPRPQTRQRKNVLRQRLFWVKRRTAVRNRVHTLLVRQRDLTVPDRADLFGKKGQQWLAPLALPDPDGWLLRQDLEMLALLDAHLREVQRHTQTEIAHDPALQRLTTIPGIGPVLAAVLGAEIDQIERFAHPAKFTADAGLMPTTRASGGHYDHGPLVAGCNQWLRWALVEAAWVAVGHDAYVGALSQHHRGRGKRATMAITIVARRLAQIVWHVLREGRDYELRNGQMRSDRSGVIVAGCS